MFNCKEHPLQLSEGQLDKQSLISIKGVADPGDELMAERPETSFKIRKNHPVIQTDFSH